MSKLGVSNYRRRIVAVTGATGFIGSHLVESLVGLGAEVVTIARSSSRNANLAAVEGRHRFLECDLSERGALTSVLSGVRPSVLFHLAAEPDVDESFDLIAARLKTNTFGLLNTLEYCIGVGCERMVLADSSKVYGNQSVPHTAAQHPLPKSSYAVSKAAAWQLAQMASIRRQLDVVNLRFTFVYGPRQNWNLIQYVERCVEKGQPVLLQGGTQTRDPMYVMDAVSALLAAGLSQEASGYAIPVGGGAEMTVHSMCSQILGILKADLPIVENAVPLRETEVFHSYSDNQDARRLLGWEPIWTFDEGLRLTFPTATERASGQSATGRLAG
jgi:nucleoside-diphosphate-sugar epimerase